MSNIVKAHVRDDLVRVRHPYRYRGRRMIIEQVVATMMAWDAYPESGSSLWSVSFDDGIARAVRVVEDDGESRRPRLFDPGRD